MIDYFDIVSKPMDFGTIKKKITHNIYNNANEFTADVKLVFSNCYRYNGEFHDISKSAKEVEVFVEENFKSHGLMKYLSD